MKVTVKVSSPFWKHTGGASEFQVEATNVLEVLGQAAAKYPALAGRLLGANGRIGGYVNVFVMDTMVSRDAAQTTAISEGDLVTIIPAIAGG